MKRLAAGTRRRVRDALRRDPDDRWAVVFGRIAGYSFAVAAVSGVLLLPLFRPSMATVAYHGSYRLLDGVPVSQAYRSVLAISFDVRGGLLIRQVHHWSADLFVAAVCLRLARVFFRGRFSGREGLPSRHPRPAVRTARVHVAALRAPGRSVPPRIPSRRDPGSRSPLPPGSAGLLFFATRRAAQHHLYRSERQRAGPAAPDTPLSGRK